MKEKRDRKQNIIIILLVIIILILLAPALLLGAVYSSSTRQMERNPLPAAASRQKVSAAAVADMIDDSCRQVYGEYYTTELDEEAGLFRMNAWLPTLDSESIERVKADQDKTVWNNMVGDIKTAANSAQAAFNDHGHDDIIAVFNVVDPADHSIIYLSVANGIAGYDVVNGIDMRSNNAG